MCLDITQSYRVSAMLFRTFIKSSDVAQNGFNDTATEFTQIATERYNFQPPNYAYMLRKMDCNWDLDP